MSFNPDIQRLFFDDLINARDLGRMPLSNGKTFIKNKIMRCGSPSLASQKAIDELKKYGVKTVIDLRSEAEVNHYGNPFKDCNNVDFNNVSLFLGDPDSDEDPTMQFLRTHPLGDFYVIVLEELSSRIIEVLRIINRNFNDGVILFHCAHGKDRTGIIAAILYLIAGASYDDIINNYKVSYEYARHFLDPLIAQREECMRHTLRSDADNMRIFLNYIDEHYDGKIEEYLTKGGMNYSEISELRSKIIN